MFDMSEEKMELELDHPMKEDNPPADLHLQELRIREMEKRVAERNQKLRESQVTEAEILKEENDNSSEN